MKEAQPIQGCCFSVISPRIAPAPAFASLRRGKSQPWAGGFNPVGIGKTYDNAANVQFYWPMAGGGNKLYP